eukprot:gnl/Hemi2/16515_TR5521_c0_g1_i1.p1 gnl/Hemi2/16515_TR5521_c0_g1~~gnl/Hemi2/16515_TR5521_c0_g1_i1.p1  ORF type:complete len:188 (-),score=30.90 gnl/Hemi2/16515_TR5521_c0_g1_i1:53-616(-)
MPPKRKNKNRNSQNVSNNNNNNANADLLVVDPDAEAHVAVLSHVLTQLVDKNDKAPVADPSNVTLFHALKPPQISIAKYLERILKYAYCSKECFVLALIYIDRVMQRNTSFVITSFNVHRLMITSIMLAAKFFDDTYCNNAYYAKVGGVPTNELNLLEIEFLFMINFSLNVTGQQFEQYASELSKKQ